VATALTSVSAIERKLASFRLEEERGARLRTSVMTHIAWVPEEWVEAAEDVLTGLAARHPSRTIVLFPQSGDGGLEGDVCSESFPISENRVICTDTIRIRLHGTSAEHPASVVEPLLIPDLPVFLRWRGLPAFDSSAFDELMDVVDRLIVDSTEWPDLPKPYTGFAEVFDRVAVSDIAWARTSRWRPMLASLWPGIADVERIKVTGTAAQACLLAGWLRSRLRHDVKLTRRSAASVTSVRIDGKSVRPPRMAQLSPSDLLSAELDTLSRDRIYEAAVRTAGSSK
jgi:glucose-6-phosphate dehydrogenase assembly protein OpcA